MQAVGTDTDPLAVKAAARNAGHNGVSERFKSLQCSPDLAGAEPLAQVRLNVVCVDLRLACVCWGPSAAVLPRPGKGRAAGAGAWPFIFFFRFQ